MIVCFPCFSQKQSNCNGPDLLKQSYSFDIGTMAVEYLYNIKSADTQFIVAPQRYIDTIFAGLSAIYNLGPGLEADSLFKYYCIHIHRSRYANRNIEMYIDKSVPWTKAWVNLNIVTGNPALDSFTSRYGFNVSYFNPSGGSGGYVMLTTNQGLNIHRLIDTFRTFEGIYHPMDAGALGSGNGIGYYRDWANHYSFKLGWNDCPSGCQAYKFWNYTVTDDCLVILDSVREYGTYNTYWPTPPNCNLFPLSMLETKTDPTINIYPNPVKNILQIKAAGDNTYVLYDILGRLLKTEQFIANASLELSAYAAGVYYIEVRNSNGTSFKKKIIKE